MLKKCIYIFTLCCLVNSQPLLADLHSHAGSNTLLDLLIGQVPEEDDDNEKTPATASCRHLLSIFRGSAANIQIPLVTIFAAFRLRGLSRHACSNSLIRKPTLPAYYNFLFRLSPF